MVVTNTAVKSPAIRDVPRKKGAAKHGTFVEAVMNARMLKIIPMLPPALQMFYAISSS